MRKGPDALMINLPTLHDMRCEGIYGKKVTACHGAFLVTRTAVLGR